MFLRREKEKSKTNRFLKPLAITGGLAAIGGLGYLGLKHRHRFLKQPSKTTVNIAQKNPIQDAYSYMGLDNSANKQSVKQRYKELSKKYHPDMGGSVDDFQRLTDNYNRLRQNLNFSYFLSDIVNF